jgi:hypothetical protein
MEVFRMAFPFAEERRARKNHLLQLLKQNPDLARDQVVAMFSAQTGISVRKAEEYLRELLAAKLLEEEEVD